ncbi:MAG: hypothetical protein ACOX6M_02425 [Armatimonadota bacterium]|nr:hypothetical protein [Acidobacteriota bacterium]
MRTSPRLSPGSVTPRNVLLFLRRSDGDSAGVDGDTLSEETVSTTVH